MVHKGDFQELKYCKDLVKSRNTTRCINSREITNLVNVIDYKSTSEPKKD